MKTAAEDIKSKAEEGGAKIKDFINEHRTRNNLFKALGIIAGVGVGAFLAVKFVPWGSVADKLEDSLEKVEEAFNKVFQENEPSEFQAQTEANL